MGFLARLSGGRPSAGGALTAFDEVFHPAAHRARRERDRQHEMAVATPSPGDRLFRDGVVVIVLPPSASGS